MRVPPNLERSVPQTASPAHPPVSYDPRGHGGSRPPQRDYPLDFYQRDADDALAIMKALGHSRFSVLGWSDGGNAALLLAATNPSAVRRLVVWGANSYVNAADLEDCRISTQKLLLLPILTSMKSGDI